MEDFVKKASNFYTDVFTVEWKKMVLPVIMVLALSASAYSTLDLRNSPQSEQRMELSVEAMTNISAVSLKTEYFNDSTNKSGKQLAQEISKEFQREEKQLNSEKFMRKAQIGQIQKIGLFPFTPELYTPVPAGREDAVSSLAVIHYRQEQFEKLDERLNSSENMTLEEFNSNVETIRNSSWENEKVQNFVENYTLDEDSGAGVLTTDEKIREQMRTGEIEKLSFISYLPAILATFLFYYVFNAFAVETGRKLYGRIKESKGYVEDRDSEDENSGEEKDMTSENSP